MSHPLPSSAIGVFDSGVGGLTVLKALMALLPSESTVYLGDTARVPYGTKSPEVVRQYALTNARFLLQHDIKMLVVACNTASAVAMEVLAQAMPIPVVGVIEPTAQAAANHSRTGHIGILGTPGTVRSGAYPRALSAIRNDIRVTNQACPLFVPLAEEGWTSGDVPRLVAESYLSSIRKDDIDAVVLGCTHYPLLRDVIGQVLGPQIALIDSAEATVWAVKHILSGTQQLATTGTPTHRYFVTDVPDRFCEVGERFLGQPIVHAEQVDVVFSQATSSGRH